MTDVRYQRNGRIGHITLDRPTKLNALTDDGIKDLRRAFDTFDDDEEAWVAILSGAGRAFSSGADVNQRQNRSVEEITRLGSLGTRDAYLSDILSGQIRMKPVIAAVHGYVLGAAVKVALYCDLLVASEGTVFQVTEVARGVDAVSFWVMLADRVGSGFADDVCVTARRWVAEEPAARGLLTRLVPSGDHLKGAQELAETVLKNPPLAVRSIVRARRSRLAALDLSARQQADRSLVLTEDFRESVQSYLQKRPAVYRGK